MDIIMRLVDSPDEDRIILHGKMIIISSGQNKELEIEKNHVLII